MILIESSIRSIYLLLFDNSMYFSFLLFSEICPWSPCWLHIYIMAWTNGARVLDCKVSSNPEAPKGQGARNHTRTHTEFYGIVACCWWYFTQLKSLGFISYQIWSSVVIEFSRSVGLIWRRTVDIIELSGIHIDLLDQSKATSGHTLLYVYSVFLSQEYNHESRGDKETHIDDPCCPTIIPTDAFATC